jgi:hypothetical protein
MCGRPYIAKKEVRERLRFHSPFWGHSPNDPLGATSYPRDQALNHNGPLGIVTSHWQPLRVESSLTSVKIPDNIEI